MLREIMLYSSPGRQTSKQQAVSFTVAGFDVALVKQDGKRPINIISYFVTVHKNSIIYSITLYLYLGIFGIYVYVLIK